MEFLIAIGIVFGSIFVYGFFKASKWEKEYKISIGKYYKLSPEESQNLSSFDGTCYFTEMITPLNLGLRLSKNEKIYAVFENLDLMKYKRDGNVGAYGITFRKKVMPGTYLRAGVGKFGMSKSLQSEANGNLYVTNKGIFFDGDKKNIKLPWEKIVRDNVSMDSIQIEKQNGSPVVFNGNINPNSAAIMTLTGSLSESLLEDEKE